MCVLYIILFDLAVTVVFLIVVVPVIFPVIILITSLATHNNYMVTKQDSNI